MLNNCVFGTYRAPATIRIDNELASLSRTRSRIRVPTLPPDLAQHCPFRSTASKNKFLQMN